MQSNEWIVEGMVELRRGGVLRIEDGRGMLVYLWDGSVWLTQDGEGRDVMLGAGGWFRIGREGVTLVYALADCKITLTSPDASRPAAAVQALQPGACKPLNTTSIRNAMPSAFRSRSACASTSSAT
jgi:hypothetical protein